MKKSFLLPIILLVISLMMMSCGKGTTHVSGTVFEKGSNKPVANASVIFSECVPGDGTGASAICIDVETVVTNAQGEYVFEKDSGNATEYRIRAEKRNYGKPTEVFQTASAGKCTENINFTLPAFAWIKFHVKNVNPFDDSDYIAAPGALNYADEYYFFGKNVDKYYVLGNKYVGNSYFVGNSLAEFYWNVSKNGITKKYKDSIFIKALDTLNYEIKY